ncbi:MAG TPA: DUF3224 domain-containing protein [Actinomycetospora sp.]|jgi:hypothetical protein|uniref:DUF3224 domain-containing protein n=1 Tax=Actinomycetospora sp. TaxID=1872135 RepID=UPI002F3F1272
MRTSGTFSVASFDPTDLVAEPPITTALPIGVARMEKVYDGDVRGRSATLFTAAFDQATGRGTYVAMEAFEGSGSTAVEADGTHRVTLDYELEAG